MQLAREVQGSGLPQPRLVRFSQIRRSEEVDTIPTNAVSCSSCDKKNMPRYVLKAILHFIEITVLYSMELPWKTFHGNHSKEFPCKTTLSIVNPRGQNIWKFHADCMKFHLEYSMELPWNTTGLHCVFICFCPREINMESFPRKFPEMMSMECFPWRFHGI